MVMDIIQRQLGSSVSFDYTKWLPFHMNTNIPFEKISGNKDLMYVEGFRILSINDKSDLDLKDKDENPFTLVFKRGSLVAYGDGCLYYKQEDLV